MTGAFAFFSRLEGHRQGVVLLAHRDIGAIANDGERRSFGVFERLQIANLFPLDSGQTGFIGDGLGQGQGQDLAQQQLFALGIKEIGQLAAVGRVAAQARAGGRCRQASQARVSLGFGD